MNLQEQIDELKDRLNVLQQNQVISYVPSGVNYKLASPNSVDPGHKHSLSSLNDFANTTLAQGDIFYVNSAGQIVNLAHGTSGQVLQTNGASANPSWVAAATAIVYGVPATLGNYLSTNPSAGNVTDTVTVGFTPRYIKLHYLLQGKNGGLSGLAARKGIAIFNATTQLADFAIFATVGTAGHNLSGDLGYVQNIDGIIASNVTATAPTTGDQVSNNGVKFTLSISATTSTSFTINLAIALSGSYVSAGDNYRCQIVYECLP